MKQPTAFTNVLVRGMLFEGITLATESGAANKTIATLNIVNAIYSRDCNGGARTDTTDTAASIIAAISSNLVKPIAGTSFWLAIRNTSAGANTLTLAGGTGVTIVGTATVAQSNVREFLGVVTDPAAKTISLYSLGASAF